MMMMRRRMRMMMLMRRRRMRRERRRRRRAHDTIDYEFDISEIPDVRVIDRITERRRMTMQRRGRASS
jgi:hypothetical protein